MPTPGTRNDRTLTIALTWRPKDGLTHRHEQLLRRWLSMYAAQWQIYEETLDDDPSTRHLHGRILLKEERRMDKIKECLCTSLGMVLQEKKVLLKGIKWLYDDWEYASKDGNLWDDQITDEDEWIYADPAHKIERKKNAEIDNWLGLIEADLPPSEVNWIQVRNLLNPYFANNTLELPMLETLQKKCARVAYMWSIRNADTQEMFI